MRLVVSALAALALAASPSAPAAAQTQGKSPTHAKKAAPPQFSPEGQNAAQPRDGYREQLTDKLPYGSSAWWQQMRREGRLGGESP